MHHELKINEPYIKAKQAGEKPFEIRYDDRGYQKGDTVSYKASESRLAYKKYPGVYEITYVTSFAQKENWVVFGEKLIETEQQ